MTRQLIAGLATDEIEIDEEDYVSSVATPIDIGMLSIMPNTIRDVLQHDRRYLYLEARKLLVSLSNVPTEHLHVASLLRISKSYARSLSL